MPRIASAEERYGWTEPPQGGWRVQPARRRPGSLLDPVAVVLALLGLAAAAAAAAWYVSIRRGAPPLRPTVPQVVGLREPAAVRELTTAGFRVRAVEELGKARVRVVSAEHPPAGVRLARGSTVTIRVANGHRP